MKTLLAIVLFLFPVVASADIIDDVANAIRTGNAKEISKYFADNVDLKVLEQENIYSKAQAELILKDFFAKHPVQEFEVIFKSKPKNDSQYAIGEMKTTNGNYRVHYLTKTATSTTVTQFRIENANE